MRSSVVLLIAVVGGYFAYHLWFAPEEVEPPTAELVVDPGAGHAGGGHAGGGESVETDRDPLLEERSGPGDPIDLSVDRRGEESGLGTDAVAYQDRVASAQRRQEDAAWKLYGQLKDARKASNASTARTIEKQIRTRYADTDAARMLLFARGRDALRKYDELGGTPEGYVAAQQARTLLTPALFISSEIVDPAQQEDLRARLRALADDLLFSGRHIEGVTHLYETRAGDTLDVLCRSTFRRKWGVRASPGLVMSLNGIKRPQDLRAGVTIRVPRGVPSIVVVKHDFRLYYLLDGAYVRDWTVGLGAERSSTPLGTFEIRSKIRNPDWFPRQGVKIPYGNPRNILGSRWMGFRDTPGLSGFGIHGTTKPESIGRMESSGCVRMLKSEVEMLFGWTPRGAKVEIRR